MTANLFFSKKIDQILLAQSSTYLLNPLFYQGDSDKIVAAYSDGTVRVWDVLTRHNRYDLKGRSPYISCVQYDATRYVRTQDTFKFLMVSLSVSLSLSLSISHSFNLSLYTVFLALCVCTSLSSSLFLSFCVCLSLSLSHSLSLTLSLSLSQSHSFYLLRLPLIISHCFLFPIDC